MAKHASASAPVDSIPGREPAPDQDRRMRTAPPKHAAAPFTWNYRVVVVTVLAVLVGLIAVGYVILGTNPASPTLAAAQAPATSSQPELATTAAPASSRAQASTVAAPPAAVDTPATTADPVPATIAGLPPAVLPTAGPGLTEPGILLVASPASDGSFNVLERIRLASPASSLTLRPATVGRAGSQFASASAVASQVQVTAGDEPVNVPGAAITAATTLPVAEGDRFEVRYRLTDVTVRSTPSTSGRALAAIGPLTGGVNDDFPVLFIASGGTVLGLSCPLLPLSERSCGSHVQPGLGVQHELPSALAITTVQFNLPAS